MVIFDCDGTLVETHRDIAASARFMCDRLGIPPADESLIPGYMGLGIDHLIRQVLGNRSDLFDAARKLYVEHHEEHCADRARLYDGAAELLDELRARGLRVGLLSNKNEHFCRLILERLGVLDRFDLVFGSDSTPWKKPDPRGLQEMRSRLGDGDALYVGDSDVDIRTGRAAGIRVGFVEHGYGRGGDEQPDYRWKDLRALLTWLRSGA